MKQFSITAGVDSRFIVSAVFNLHFIFFKPIEEIKKVAKSSVAQRIFKYSA